MSDDLIRKLECQKCLKELDIPRHQRGDFSEDVYVLRSGIKFPLFKQVGFCRTCNKFEWMERFPSHSDVLGKLAEFHKKIEAFQGGETWWGRPLYDFYSPIVRHKAEWLNLLASRNRPVCLSCGTGDVDVVSHDQLQKTVGDIDIQHGICGGRIFGSFYKSPYPSIRLSPRRRNWDAPIEFNEYSPRGHKRGSFYYQMYSAMESEILGIAGSSSQRWTEPDEEDPNSLDFLNWMRAFVHAELESIPLHDSVKKVYTYFPEFMAMIEPQAREEIAKFYQEVTKSSTPTPAKSGGAEASLWKKLFG